ncbi:MAG: hypothetical protein J6C54_00575 [Lachnospiraceae bacterium]|nr:hypothetical protein [Lachnospiraceae bacterium]
MNTSDLSRNACLLSGSQSKRGYMRWFHSFCGTQPETGERRTFFIEYMIMNPSLGSNKPILGQLPYNKKRGIRPSYLLLKAGAFAGDGGSASVQLHKFYPLTELKVALNPLIIQYGDNFYSEQHISGYVDVSHEESRRKSHMTDEGQMEWDLEVHKSIACHTGTMADAFHNTVNALDSFWHGEGIKTQYRGTVILDGVSYQVTPQDSYGYADKHWGRGFNCPWLQLASCHLISERTGRELKHSALAIDGCCPRFLWFRLKRKLLLQLTYEGEDFNFNFSPFAKECKWNVKVTNKRLVWQIVARNKDAVAKVTVSSLKETMLGLHYENPDGKRPVGLVGGRSGCGKVLLYRMTDEGKELIDTLTVEDALTIYEA